MVATGCSVDLCPFGEINPSAFQLHSRQSGRCALLLAGGNKVALSRYSPTDPYPHSLAKKAGHFPEGPALVFMHQKW